MLGSTEDAKELKLWAGFNMPLYLSIATVILGLILYSFHRPLRNWLADVTDRAPNFDRGWDSFLVGLKGLAAWQTRTIQTGVLRHYIFATFGTVLVAIVATMVGRQMVPDMPDFTTVTWKNVALVAIIVAGSLITMVTRSRITALAALGVVGIGVAVIFIVFSAPDVAITQLLVETLVVVLLGVALLRLPTLDTAGSTERRPWDIVLAVAVGTAVTLVLLAVLQGTLDPRLTDYFEVTSWPEAFGRNIVNVILVDFRALDTFGEIAVVVIAALSAYALLRTTHDAKSTADNATKEGDGS